MDDVEMEIAKPLDSLIAAERKKNRRGRGGRGRGGRGGRGRGARGGRSASRGGSRNQKFSSRPIQKTRDRNPRWKHDKFETMGNGKSARRSKKPMEISTGTKIAVSGLEPTITSDDVREIFLQIGKVKNVIVQYDQNGTSLGTASITFLRKQDAVTACKDYDKAMVDGRAMRVEMIGTVDNIVTKENLGAPNSPRQQRSRGGGGRGRGRGGGGRGGGRNRGRGGAGRGGAGRGGGGGGGRDSGPSNTFSNPLLRGADDGDVSMDTSFGGKRAQKTTLFGSALRGALAGRRGKKGLSDEQQREQLDADMTAYHEGS